MKTLIILLLVVLGTASCSSMQYSTCPTYASSKPHSMKAGTYNPRKPAGLEIGKAIVGRIQ